MPKKYPPRTHTEKRSVKTRLAVFTDPDFAGRKRRSRCPCRTKRAEGLQVAGHCLRRAKCAAGLRSGGVTPAVPSARPDCGREALPLPRQVRGGSTDGMAENRLLWLLSGLCDPGLRCRFIFPVRLYAENLCAEEIGLTRKHTPFPHRRPRRRAPHTHCQTKSQNTVLRSPRSLRP